MRDEDANNQNSESDTAQRERHREARVKQRRGTVLESRLGEIAHDRHGNAVFERAAWRQDMDFDDPAPLDASGNLADRVRATFGRRTAVAEAAALEEAAAEARAEAAAEEAEGAGAAPPGRGNGAVERDGVDGEKPTPIQAALARLQKKQDRSKSPAPSLRPVPRLRRRPSDGLVGGTPIRGAAPATAAPARQNRGRGGPGRWG